MTATIRGALLLVLSLLAAGASLAQPSHIEDFTTTTYRNDSATTAFWDTASGQLRLNPFAPSIIGSYTSLSYARGADLAGDILYIADGYAGLRIFDVSDPATPTLLATYNTPGYSYAVQVAGSYAYVADHSGGLQVIDVTDPAAPVFADSQTTTSDALGIAVVGDHVFLGIGLNGLVVVDVSDPTNVTLIGSVDTPGDAARGVCVAGNYAYVADGLAGLQVINISDPAAPVIAGTFNTPGYAYEISLSGNRAFVSDQGTGVVVLDVTVPKGPLQVGLYNDNGNARGLAVAGDRLYLADDGAGLKVLDISGSGSPILVHTVNTPGYAYALTCAGDNVYVADQGGGVQVIRVAEFSPPMVAESYLSPGVISRVFVDGRFAYAVDSAAGLLVLDVSNAANPFVVGNINPAGSEQDVVTSGDFAFLASGSAGLKVIHVRNPSAPILVGSVVTPSAARRLQVAGDRLYVAAKSGLLTYDITDPTVPVLIGSVATPGSPADLDLAGDLAFVADGANGLQVVDISNAVPTLVATLGLTYDAVSIHVAGDYAFVGSANGLETVDIINPAVPVLAESVSFNASIVDVASLGDRLYLSVTNIGTVVRDITTPALSTGSSFYSGGGVPTGIFLAGNWAYLPRDLSGSTGVNRLDVCQVLQDEVFRDDRNMVSLAYPTLGDTIMRVRISATGVLPAGTSATIMTHSSGGRGVLGAAIWAKASSLGGYGTGIYCDSQVGWQPGQTAAIDEIKLEWLYKYPWLNFVSDIAADQGGQVRVQWARSGHDFVGEERQVVEYAVYRRYESGQKSAQVPASVPDQASAALRGNVQAMQGTGWDFVASVPVLIQDLYSVVVPTLADSSLTGGQNFSVFKVVALTAIPGVYFTSPPDSGYSVDNLAPGVPMAITAAYQAGTVALVWDDAPEADFRYFRVYRGTTPGFAPSPGNLVDEVAVSAWTDQVSDTWQYYYKISAVDFAGNEGPAGEVVAASEVPGSTGAVRFALQAAAPNPFNPATTIRYSLDRTGSVQLVIYDVSGRAVRTLVDDVQATGAHSVVWNGTNEAGLPVASGVYLYRLRAGGETEQRRMMLVK